MMDETESIKIIANENLKYISSLSDQYKSADPFPHLIIDGLWEKKFISIVEKECSRQEYWSDTKFDGFTSNKKACNDTNRMGKETKELIRFCNSPIFLKALEKVTGEKGLIPDPYLLGGGIHCVEDKGLLKMHVDFNWHPNLKLYRRLNLLIYLNRKWKGKWGGDLRLARQTKKGLEKKINIYPIINRTVLFTTSDISIHGHPEPMSLPENINRKSIALYYYIAEKPPEVIKKRIQTTLYYDFL